MDEELARRVARRYLKAKADSEARTEVIESAYFHTGNGGLTLDILHKWFPDTPDLNLYSLQASYNHMGSGITCEFPLESMDIAGWVHEVTGRLLLRMAKQPDEARYLAYDYMDCGDVSVENGIKKDYKFRWDGQGKHLVVENNQQKFSSYGRIINISEVEADIQSRAPNKDPSFKLEGSWKKYLFDMQGYSVFAVNGSWVRTNLSILFGHGGHGYVHEFIPVNEIWVGSRHWDENEFNNCGCGLGVDAVSKEYFLSCVVHEIAECEQMKQGAPYLPSHIESLGIEKDLGLLQDPNMDDGSTPL